jgi:lantibiotic biosynthesis protein
MMNESRLHIQDFYLLRTPVYPVEYALQLNELFYTITIPEAAHSSLLKIKEQFSDPLFVEAVFYASKELFSLLVNWLQEPVYNKESQKLLKSLHRYYSRMCTRCTPFGLFAGCGLGAIKEVATDIVFDPNEDIIRHVRFDAGMLAELASQLMKDKAAHRSIRVRLNDMLYRRGGKLAFLESTGTGIDRSYVISALSQTPYLDHIVSVAGNSCYADELVASLQQFDGSISGDRYEKYVQDLIACQFLTSELIPNVTGEDYGKRLMALLAGNALFDPIQRVLHSAHEVISEPHQHKNYFISAQQILDPLQAKTVSKNALQLDTHLQFQNNNINKKIVEEIVQASAELWHINEVSSTDALNSFINRFKARYEEQAVPLLTALDADVGIGYGVAVNGNTENMPLLSGIAFQSGQLPGQGKRSALQEFAGSIYDEYLGHKLPVIQLKEAAVAALIKKNGSREEAAQQLSAFVFGSILASSGAAVDKGDYKFVAHHLHNHSAGRMLGRFAGSNKKMLDYLQQSDQRETLANPDVLIAEVVHAPAGHVLNVVLRPAVRQYEIPILCYSSVAKDFVILLQDLLVTIRNNRVVLFSKKHNKEVIPRITNAFNAQKGEPVYRFLADTSAQLTRPFFQWDWFDWYNKPFLPRIEYKKMVLSRAIWKIEQVDVTAYKTDEQILEYFNAFRDRYAIPRHVVMVQDSDNELLLDTAIPFCMSQLIRGLKKRSVTLTEYLSTPDQCFITSGKYHFNNQVVILLDTNERAFPAVHLPAIGEDPVPQRDFLPGSHWLYYKIYGGNKMLDLMIPSVFKPLSEALLQNGIVDKWFFIRYNDPDSHLRIRFHCTGQTYATVMEQVNKLLAPYIQNKELDRVVIDTYKREIERYGAALIEDSETLFYHDSTAVMDILDAIDGDAGDQVRWWAALKSVDAILDDFNLNTPQKQSLLQAMSRQFFKEFATGDATADKRLKVSLSNKYRLHTAEITNALNNKQYLDSFLYTVFEQRSNSNRAITGRLFNTIQLMPDSEEVIRRFLRNHIHMNVNRLFIAQPRKHEMVLYHFLNEFYRSQIAIQKAKSKVSQHA